MLSVIVPATALSEVLSEPFEQLRIYFMLGTILMFILCLLTKFWVTSGFHAILTFVHLYIITVAYPISQKEIACKTSDKIITVLAYNIFYKNMKTDAIINTILNADADIVALQEGKEKFLDQSYDQLSKRYPFSYPDHSKGEFFSPAIFSKYPIINIKKEKMPISAVRILQARIDIEGQEIELASIHAISPKNTRTIKKRNLFIQDLANHSQNLRYQGHKFIFAGDFNSVPWHSKMIALQKQGGLSGNPSLTNYFGTWPNWGAPLFSVPIDHIFSSEGFKKISYKKASHSAGSDHFPIKSALYLCK